ncbi:MAG: NUDIX hydrolase [Paracoccaceae bacterium]|nr:NUDIX hydrolase [Paracoccaceae bacterium]
MAPSGEGIFGRLLRFVGLGDSVEQQFGAVPYRRGAGGLEFLLITSRRTGRWIFPKGGKMPFLSASDTAAEEAYEEAGVRGSVETRPLGSYRDIKIREDGETMIEVDMYPMMVEEELLDWPEKDQRRRRWVGLDEATILLSHPELVTIVKEIAAREAGEGDA